MTAQISGMARILVIGLGEIGKANANHVKQVGLECDGFDNNRQTLRDCIDSNLIKRICEHISNYDYYLICVSTHNPAKMSEPDLKSIYEVLGMLQTVGNKKALIAIESTIPPEKTLFKSMIQSGFDIVHCPHRYWKGDLENYNVAMERVIGANTEQALARGIHFYRDILKVKLYEPEPGEGHFTLQEAAALKCVENSDRYLKIAWAEEVRMYCHAQGFNWKKFRGGLNSKPNVQMLEAYDGIGGHCLPKDSLMYINYTIRHSLLVAAHAIDDAYRKFLIKLKQ